MRARRLDARASASAVACHALLSSVLAAQDGARASFLAHTISAGADVITLRPAVALCHVAEIGRLDPEGREALMGGTSELPDGPLARAVERFLLAYGDRGLLENELAVPRFGEDRGALLSLLSTLLRGESVDAEVAVAQSRALADRQFSLLEQRLSFFEGRLCRDLVSRYREHLRLRERCRARVAHGLAMMRFVALDVDRRIRRLDPSLEESSALFLTLDELSVAVKRYRADLSPIVRARRLDLEAERRSEGPPPCFRGIPEPLLAARSNRAMHGIPCATGTAEARITRLGPRLEGLDAFQPGDVLAVQSLDLGHAPLFFQARAVVSEIGTPTASAAVVARDCGIPVVACLPGLLQVLRNGDRVAVDGDAGTVERLGP